MKVSVLSLGAMMFGHRANPSHEQGVRIINDALDSGINLVDTADVYSAGESEEIVGEALGKRRDSVILATKFHGVMGPDLNQRGNSRRWIMQACEASLRRLRTDWIDIYQVHRPDSTCDIDETLGALSDLLHSGKVRAIGSSTFLAEEIVEAQWVSERRARERFVTEQSPYSIFARGAEASVFPTCQRYHLGVLVWSPLNAGWLTGVYRKDAATRHEGRPIRMPERYDPAVAENGKKLDAVESLINVAEDAGVPLIHLALAFVLQHPAVTSAIIGPRTLEQLTSQLPAADLELPEAVMNRIDDIVQPGENLHHGDSGRELSALTDAWRRRRLGAACQE
jgi:aryl-alcohol dehydrogenase-like predicted oxidoreductase